MVAYRFDGALLALILRYIRPSFPRKRSPEFGSLDIERVISVCLFAPNSTPDPVADGSKHGLGQHVFRHTFNPRSQLVSQQLALERLNE